MRADKHPLAGIHRPLDSRMIACKVTGWHAYCVKYSPFDQNLIACAGNKEYGIRGQGAVLILTRTHPRGTFQVKKIITHHEAIFDLTFSENDPNILCAAAACGSFLILDIREGSVLTSLRVHSKEVSSVHWNPNRNASNFLLSSSWDQSVALIDAEKRKQIKFFLGHKNLVYAVVWNPRLPQVFCSASGDGSLAVWDIRAERPQTGIRGTSEILTTDWSYYESDVLAIGSVDSSVQIWDLRNTRAYLKQYSHQRAVKKVKFNPFVGFVIASVSYDFRTRIFHSMADKVLYSVKNHSEFVYGLDWSLVDRKELVDCGWDQLLCVNRVPLDKMSAQSTI